MLVDTKDFDCSTCKRHMTGKCDTWCENGEQYSPNMNALKPINAVPMVHGRWIFSGDDDEYMNCSACGNQRYSTDLDHKSDITSYCPSCGARMDGREQDNGTRT